MTREERRLWMACKRDHEWARMLLIERHLNLVAATRRRCCSRAPVSFTEDLEAEGRAALVRAVDAYDPARGVAFTSFAIGRLRGAMLEWLRKEDWVPRSIRQRLRAGEAVEFLELVSLEALGDEEDEKALLERLADPRALDGDQVTERLSYAVAGRLARALPRAERRVIEGVYYRGQCYDQVAQEMNRSLSRVHQLHAQALSRLQQWLEPWRQAYAER